MAAMSKYYPYIKYPKCIQDIYEQEPEIPQLKLPAKPLLPTIKLSIPKYPSEPQEPTFTFERPSRKYNNKTLFLFMFSLTISSLILGNFFKLPGQISLGVVLIVNALNFLLYFILQKNYQKELKQYSQVNKDFQKIKDTFLKEHQEWKNKCKNITEEWEKKLEEARDTANQQHQIKLEQWKEECRAIRQQHQKIVEQLQAPDYLKRWQQEKIQNVVVQLKPLPLQKRRKKITEREKVILNLVNIVNFLNYFKNILAIKFKMANG